MSDDDELEITPDAVSDDTPADDSTSRRSYTRKLNELERRQLEAETFWRQVLAHPVGAREIWGVIADAHTFEERFACGPNGFPNEQATWFHAGEQAFGLRLFMRLQLLAPEQVFAMQREFDPRFQKPKPPKRKKRGE